jgi:hypothetical protein
MPFELHRTMQTNRSKRYRAATAFEQALALNPGLEIARQGLNESLKMQRDR